MPVAIRDTDRLSSLKFLSRRTPLTTFSGRNSIDCNTLACTPCPWFRQAPSMDCRKVRGMDSLRSGGRSTCEREERHPESYVEAVYEPRNADRRRSGDSSLASLIAHRTTIGACRSMHLRSGTSQMTVITFASWLSHPDAVSCTLSRSKKYVPKSTDRTRDLQADCR